MKSENELKSVAALKKRFFVPIISLLLLFGLACQRGPDDTDPDVDEETIVTNVDVRIEFRSSFGGTPAIPPEVLIRCGDKTARPDSLGRVYFSNTKVPRHYATVQAFYPTANEWAALRGFVPQEDHNFVSTELYDDPNDPGAGVSLGTPFNSNEPYQENSNQHSELIPANALANQDGSDYNGTAYYYSGTVLPTDRLNILTQTSDYPYYSRDEDKRMQLLHMFGSILAITITDNRGRPLKLRKGSKVTLNYRVPLSQDPQSALYVYCMNQETGIWKKASEQVVVNGGWDLTAELEMLGFLMFAVPNEAVLLRTRLKDNNDFPVYSQVSISSQSNREVFTIAQSNVNGTISAYVPRGEALNLDIIPMSPGSWLAVEDDREIICRVPIGAISVDTEIPATLITNQSTAIEDRALITLRGQVVDCNGQPVAGAQLLETDSRQRAMPTVLTDQNGRFGFSISMGRSLTAKLWRLRAFNPSSGYISNELIPSAINEDYRNLNIDMRVVKLCQLGPDEYVVLSFDNSVVSEFRPPLNPPVYNFSGQFLVNDFSNIEEIAVGSQFQFSFRGDLGSGSRPMASFLHPSIGVPYRFGEPVPALTITESRNGGGRYTAGEIKGLQVVNASNQVRTVDISFRVKN